MGLGGAKTCCPGSKGCYSTAKNSSQIHVSLTQIHCNINILVYANVFFFSATFIGLAITSEHMFNDIFHAEELIGTNEFMRMSEQI